MSDFGKLVRETFSGRPGLPPALDAKPIDIKVSALDERMRTIGRLTWLSVTLMAAIAITMVVLLLSTGPHTETSRLVLYAAIFVWSILVIAMAKLWHFQMQAHTAGMKEILRVQLMLLHG